MNFYLHFYLHFYLYSYLYSYQSAGTSPLTTNFCNQVNNKVNHSLRNATASNQRCTNTKNSKPWPPTANAKRKGKNLNPAPWIYRGYNSTVHILLPTAGNLLTFMQRKYAVVPVRRHSAHRHTGTTIIRHSAIPPHRYNHYLVQCRTATPVQQLSGTNKTNQRLHQMNAASVIHHHHAATCSHSGSTEAANWWLRKFPENQDVGGRGSETRSRIPGKQHPYKNMLNHETL